MVSLLSEPQGTNFLF